VTPSSGSQVVPKWFPFGAQRRVVPGSPPYGNRNHRQWFPGTTQTEGTTRSTNPTQKGLIP